ncbi:hypothetical protein LCGC14_3024660, partial [marine sediment metagenome]
MTKKLKEQIKKKEEELKELKAKLREESEKDIWLEIPERGIKITTKLQFTGKTYSKILKEVDESSQKIISLEGDLTDIKIKREQIKELEETRKKKYISII